MANRLAITELSLQDWSAAGASLLLLPASRVAIALLGYRRGARIISKVAPWWSRSPSPVETTEFASRLAQVVGGLSRRLPMRLHCLHRAVVIDALLKKAGIPSQVHLGARPGNAFQAHAWVCVAGQAVGEPHSVQNEFGLTDARRPRTSA